MTRPSPPPLPHDFRGVFVAGTDTGVGKTLISALLCRAWKGTYWKPFQTGLDEENGDTATVKTLANLSSERIFPPSYALRAPLSPLAAARRENILIDPARLKLPNCPAPLIVEGAGGLMVPLCDDMLLIDLIKQFSLPVILVARSGLGTLNHTLLSLEALYCRSIPVLGFVMNGGDHAENRLMLEQIGQTRCLFTIPHFIYPSPDAVIGYIDGVPLWLTLGGQNNGTP